MPMFRSSIFSSDTLAECNPRGSGSWQAVVAALCLVAAAEVIARTAVAPLGAYWEYWTPAAATKFETYRGQVQRGTPPQLLAVGDSTAARDIEPAVVADAAAARDAFNLGWPANFPLAFRESTLPLLQADVAPRTVVASFSPASFFDSTRVRRFEESILSSSYARRLKGERQVSDVVFLSRLRAGLPFRKNWWGRRPLPLSTDAGFMPLNGTDTAVDVAEENEPFADERFGVLEQLAAAGRAHGFDVVIVVPPRLAPTPARAEQEQVYVARLKASGLHFLDFRDAAFLGREHFYDSGHLNREGARIFSRRLGEALRATVAARSNAGGKSRAIG